MYRSRLEVHPGGIISISDRFAPTLADANDLRARRNALAESLNAGAASQIAMMVSEMFLAFPSVRMDGATAKKTTAAYVAVLQKLPAWAVERGCKACVERDVPFPPSAGELFAACERLAQPVRDEQADIRKILEAQVYHEHTEGERARIKAGFKALLDELQWNKPFDVRKRSRDGRDATTPTEPQRDTRPLPTLSDEALAVFNKRGTVAAE